MVPAPTLELTSVHIPRSDPELELDGMWRTLSWDGAQAEAGDQVPHIDGLPVVQVQLQTVEQGKQPLMVVAQQLSSGEVIRTIEGPMGDVSHLLAGRTSSNPDSMARIQCRQVGLDPIAFGVRSRRPHHGHAAGRPHAGDHGGTAVGQSAGDDSEVERGDEE